LRFIRSGIHLGGLVTAGCYALLAGQSRGEEPVPLTLFFTLLGVAWAILLILHFRRHTRQVEIPLLSILLWAAVFRLAGLSADPLYEDDFNRFLWDGWVFATTGNPYQIPPADFFGDESVPEAFLPILHEVNYPTVATIYGPVLEYLFGLSYLLSPGSLTFLKILFLASDLTILGLLCKFASRHAVLLYAWCPLLIFEVAFNAHPDLLGTALLFAGFLAHSRDRAVTAAVFGALACGVKVLAVLALPFFILRGGLRAVFASAATLLVVYSPFILQGSTADWDGLSVFMRFWEFNSALFAVFSHFLENPAAKFASYGLFALAYSAIFLSWARNRSNLPPLDIVYGLFFLASPVINPWYLLWMLPFVTLRPKLWSLVALIAVCASYATVSNLNPAVTGNFSHPVWVRPLEFGIIGLALTVDLLIAKTRTMLIRGEDSKGDRYPGNIPANRDNTLVIIPAYNESGTIATVVMRLQALGFTHVRVVDNASTDDTAQQARSAGAEVVNEPRRGYGSACLAGYRKPDPHCDWVLFCDADGSDDLERIPALLDQSAEYEFVLGDRRGSQAGKAVMTVPQYYGNGLAVTLIRWGWGFRYGDLGPMRLIHLAALHDLRMRDRNYGWTVEMQIRAVEEGLRIKELPVGYFERVAGRSKISGTVTGTLKAGYKILWTVFRSYCRSFININGAQGGLPHLQGKALSINPPRNNGGSLH